MRFAIALLLTAISLSADALHEPITPENVSQLKAAWTYDTGETPHSFLEKKSNPFRMHARLRKR